MGRRPLGAGGQGGRQSVTSRCQVIRPRLYGTYPIPCWRKPATSPSDVDMPMKLVPSLMFAVLFGLAMKPWAALDADVTVKTVDARW